MINEKKALRNQFAQRKMAYPLEQRKSLSALLLAHLEASPRFISSQTILFYYSLPDEVCTHDFVEKWQKEKTILLPVVKGEELELRQYAGETSMNMGAYGIKEPTGAPFVAYEKIDLAIIPGVSFDKERNRLGRGKGYYDRLLPKLTSYNIGVCFGFQLSESIPCEEFDRKVDAVLTEEGWISER